MRELLNYMVQHEELGIEQRVRTLEQVLFKSNQSDRLRLFDHIYEKIDNVDRKLKIESDRMEKALRRVEKQSHQISVLAETHREQLIVSQEKMTKTNEDMVRSQIQIREWQDQLMKNSD